MSKIETLPKLSKQLIEVYPSSWISGKIRNKLMKAIEAHLTKLLLNLTSLDRIHRSSDVRLEISEGSDKEYELVVITVRIPKQP